MAALKKNKKKASQRVFSGVTFRKRQKKKKKKHMKKKKDTETPLAPAEANKNKEDGAPQVAQFSLRTDKRKKTFP